jgi:hypothetical protein
MAQPSRDSDDLLAGPLEFDVEVARVLRPQKPARGGDLQHEGLVVVLSLSSAIAFAASSTLKHVSAGRAPDAQSLEPGKLGPFISVTVSHRLWQSGIVCDAFGLLFQVFALHLGALVVVQPLLISGLLFALLFRQRFEHHQITSRQLGWAAVLAAALAGFMALVVTSTSSHDHADRLPAHVAAVIGGLLALACVELSRRQRSPSSSAALLGMAVGVIYAATAALVKAMTNIAVRNPFALLISWQLYVVAVLGIAGLLLNQLAFQSGPITASLPATATIDPLLSIVVGVMVYDEHIRRGPGGGTVLIGLLLLLTVAVIQLARSSEKELRLQDSRA